MHSVQGVMGQHKFGVHIGLECGREHKRDEGHHKTGHLQTMCQQAQAHRCYLLNGV